MAKKTQVFPQRIAKVSILEADLPVPYSVKVGIKGAEAEAPKTPHEGDQASGMTVVEVATIHEFGLGHMPERSFMRRWVDANRTKVQEMMRVLGRKLIKGEITEAQAANIIGLFAQGGIQEFISIGDFEPLSEAYAKRKGDPKVLIDTGQLRSSITYETKVNEKPEPGKAP